MVLWAVGTWWPAWLGPALWATVAWLLWVLLRLLRRPGLRVVDLDQSLEMQDSLATLIASGAGRSMSPWLQRHVTARLQQMPAPRRRRVWWGAMRRALVLLPLVWLAIWLGPLWSLLPLGLSPSGGPSPEDQVATDQRDPTPGDAGSDSGTDPGAPASKPQGPKPGADEPGQQPPSEPPAPQPLIPALPLQREFVVPTWIDKGPSTRAKAPVVAVPKPLPEDPSRPRSQPQKPAPRQPEQQQRAFQRAAEQAQHARHVPPNERGFVRRYFGELVRGGRGR